MPRGPDLLGFPVGDVASLWEGGSRHPLKKRADVAGKGRYSWPAVRRRSPVMVPRTGGVQNEAIPQGSLLSAGLPAAPPPPSPTVPCSPFWHCLSHPAEKPSPPPSP